MQLYKLLLLLLGAFYCSCAGAHPNDPYETLNRHTYAMNKTLDKVFLKPTATIYKKITPWPLRKGIHNAYDNLAEVPSLANHILQGEFQRAGRTLFRFLLNSTVGLLGLVDVAQHLGLERDSQDLGITFARWGFKDSSYLVMPILGPMTQRDALGNTLDLGLLSIYPHIKPVRLRNGLLLGRIVDMRTALLDVDNFTNQAALDPYAFERDAYLQYRTQKIWQNEHPDQDMNDTFVEPL
jgi:phospholipid-binding lipoprotein MlaA